MEKFITTPKGTKLPLLNLKGKNYLQGAYRLVWLNEEYSNFEINTNFLLLTDDQTIAQSTVKMLDKDGKVVKQATATKRENKKDFMDHTEKAESGSVFRALAMLGIGTQHAVAEFDEGARIADAPLDSVEKKSVSSVVAEVKKPTFRKPVSLAASEPVVDINVKPSGWE